MGRGPSSSGCGSALPSGSAELGWAFFFLPLMKTLNMFARPFGFFFFFFADSFPSRSRATLASRGGTRSSEEASDTEVSESPSDVEGNFWGLLGKSGARGRS